MGSLDSSIDLPVAKLTILIFVELYLYIFPLNCNCINGESIKERERLMFPFTICVWYLEIHFILLCFQTIVWERINMKL